MNKAAMFPDPQPPAQTLHCYCAYNLIVQSEFPLPELLPMSAGDGSPERAATLPVVHIRQGDVPTGLEQATAQGVLYQASANQFLLKLDRIARYLVRNGNEIIIQPATDALASDIRVFLLGSCFGALLHQRELLVLHASGIQTERGALLFCGPSGIGKSALLGELLKRGYPMVVDDVCAVTVDGTGQPMVLPAYPRTRLWADSAKALQIDTEGLERTRPTMEKYERQLPDQFFDQPTPLRHIYHLTTHNQDDMRLEPLPPIQTFNAVLHNTYRYGFLDGLALRRPHFQLVSAVAGQVGVTRVARPSGRFTLQVLADAIEAALAAAPAGTELRNAVTAAAVPHVPPPVAARRPQSTTDSRPTVAVSTKTFYPFLLFRLALSAE